MLSVFVELWNWVLSRRTLREAEGSEQRALLSLEPGRLHIYYDSPQGVPEAQDHPSGVGWEVLRRLPPAVPPIALHLNLTAAQVETRYFSDQKEERPQAEQPTNDLWEQTAL